MTIDSSGYFRDAAGARFIPVGANYWPASCGVEMWQAWPEDEIFSDLDLMASLGFNTVRFFVRWPDFEPRPGEYDATMLSRLLRLLDACGERGLRPQPSLFVGWMSGGIFWPPWKSDTQNLFSDPVMIERGAAYARTITTHLKPFATHLCGIDLGNELDALPDCSAATPAQVHEWCRRMTGAIREVLPEALILSGCDHQQVIADTGWRLGGSSPCYSAGGTPAPRMVPNPAQPGIDVLTMHGYPVPNWHPVQGSGLADPLTRSLLPFYVKCARAFGPVLLQEFGTILTSRAAAPHTDAYLRAILPACREAGANGYLWWCFKDIPAPLHPYIKNNFESELGLVDIEGRVKKGLEYFVEFARAETQRALKVLTACEQLDHSAEDAPTVHLYWPRHYYHRNNHRNPGNEPRETSRRLILAHHLLQSAEEHVGIVRGDQPLPSPSEVERIIITGVFTGLDEIKELHSWVEQGGQLLWHAPDPVNWAQAMSRLVGAEIADYRAATPAITATDEGPYEFTCFLRGMRVRIEPRGAQILMTDNEGSPLVLRHRVGAGCVTSVLADVEASFLSQWPDRQTQEASWSAWYAALLTKDQSEGVAR
ncbi:endo-beta-mannanase [Opitutaceae bacterium TAV5]|uniref:Endo-beta-mannanase n=2 Tax=Opitutaceae bacterium TAV5 TaxID=794903 RepID=A0ACD6B8Q6_9BACT|nr:endo-beta-mannanase [Opitutaceae bacterium TAV5]